MTTSVFGAGIFSIRKPPAQRAGLSTFPPPAKLRYSSLFTSVYGPWKVLLEGHEYGDGASAVGDAVGKTLVVEAVGAADGELVGDAVGEPVGEAVGIQVVGDMVGGTSDIAVTAAQDDGQKST